MQSQAVRIYPTDSQRPLFDIATMPLAHIIAYYELLRMGLQAVLCTQNKIPLWRGWPKHRPTLTNLVHHAALIGHVPAALLLVVFDVDYGSAEDVERFVRMFPPLLQVPSAQPGRWHLYYRCEGHPVRNAEFSGHGLAGEIRCLDGFVVLYGDAVLELRDALLERRTSAPPPLHLIRRPEPQSTNEAGAAVRTVASDPPWPPKIGSPNPTLWRALSRWAYRQTRGRDLIAWRNRVIDEAHRLHTQLGNPLSSSTVESMGIRTADWVWTHLDDWDTDNSQGLSRVNRRRGKASGAARRHGTPLELDPQPWVTLGISKATYYRNYRWPDRETSTPKTCRLRPWIELGISPAGFRQRVCRARAGKYAGADQGRPPWEYVGVSEELWSQHYAPKSKGSHAFETEPRIARGQRSAESRDVSTDEPRRARRHGPLDKAVAAGLDEYLQIREAAHGADLHRLGLPRFGLRRPMAPVGQYDPYDPESRRRYAMAKGDVDKRNREVASLIWEKERVLGLAPSIPPWVAIREVLGSAENVETVYSRPGRRSDTALRSEARRYIAAHYGPAAHFITAEEEWPDLLTICCGPDCGAPLTPHQVLCVRCQNLTQTPVACPNCGESTTAFSIKGEDACTRCAAAAPAEFAARTNHILQAWLQLQEGLPATA